jgi:phospholipid/cholesterol/gamma-HCH transport system substrate-binding protein
VNQVVAGIDPAKVASAIDGIAGFSDELKSVTPDIDTVVADAKAAVAGARDFADNLTARKDDLNAIVADAKELADKLNAASARIDSLLGAAEEVLDDESGAGRNFFREAAAAAKELREAAHKFNARADQIAGGLADFSSRGLADVSALVSEMRASVARIDRAVSDFARNPGGAVLGGNSGVREYNRR